MHDFQPSRTALRVAVRRAAHQLADRPIVFADPLAIPILGPGAETWIQEEVGRKDHPAGRALRAFLAARGRYAEEQLALAVQAGARQYVVLGAGLDTFACRNPHASAGLRVFEVDHPATQLWKHNLLHDAGITPPLQAVFVPVDFERQSLAGELLSAGFEQGAPAFFACLGVVPYLTEPAFRSTLEFVAAHPGPCGIVFDYAVAHSRLGLLERLALDALSRRVAAAGEPFQLFLEPDALARQLRLLGFTRVEDLGRDELNSLYFHGRHDGFEVRGGPGRLAAAWRD